MACINLVLAPRPDSRRAPNNWYVISESLVGAGRVIRAVILTADLKRKGEWFRH